jgi:hypothetical protein
MWDLWWTKWKNLWVVHFPFRIIPTIAQRSYSFIIIQGWESRPNSGLNVVRVDSVPLQETKKNELRMTARVGSRVRWCCACGRQSGTGVGYLLVLPYLLPIFIPSNVRHLQSSIIVSGLIGEIMARVKGGFSLTLPYRRKIMTNNKTH